MQLTLFPKSDQSPTIDRVVAILSIVRCASIVANRICHRFGCCRWFSTRFRSGRDSNARLYIHQIYLIQLCVQIFTNIVRTPQMQFPAFYIVAARLIGIIHLWLRCERIFCEIHMLHMI